MDANRNAMLDKHGKMINEFVGTRLVNKFSRYIRGCDDICDRK